MKISLDYDDTFTKDPDFWLKFVLMCRMHGHVVYCVTARGEGGRAEVMENLGQYLGEDRCFFTNLQGKRSYMFRQGISIDVWIDDNPGMILSGVDHVENSGLAL